MPNLEIFFWEADNIYRTTQYLKKIKAHNLGNNSDKLFQVSSPMNLTDLYALIQHNLLLTGASSKISFVDERDQKKLAKNSSIAYCNTEGGAFVKILERKTDPPRPRGSSGALFGQNLEDSCGTRRSSRQLVFSSFYFPKQQAFCSEA